MIDKMTKEMEQEYKKSLDFWNNWLGQENEIPEGFNPETDWKEIGSEELANAAALLGTQLNVLDYGCGSGWASVIILKSGCAKVTGMDVSENGVKAAKKYAALFKVSEQIQFRTIEPDGLDKEPASEYDGFFCSNVLDVVPRAVGEDILKGASHICKKGAKIVIGLNPYFDEEMQKKQNMIEVEPRHMFCDGILRIVNYTDEEWKEILGKYFRIVECRHFRWDGEPEYVKRRIFVLEK